MHSLTTMHFMEGFQEVKNSRFMWTQASENRALLTPSVMLMFGGCNEFKKPLNDLWLVRPDISTNKTEVLTPQA